MLDNYITLILGVLADDAMASVENNCIYKTKGMCSSGTRLFLLPICRTDQHGCQCGQGKALYHLCDI